MSPLRTIQDAFFTFLDTDGRRVWAQRAETHDIPEGEDLDRGDASNAFTLDGSEPPATPGSFISSIDLNWTTEEWERWVDAGKINEILGHLNQLSPQERQRGAVAVLQAEQGRGDKARPELLQSLGQFVDYIPQRSDADTSSGSDLSVISDDDLAAWVKLNSTEAVMASVGSNEELAGRVRAVELGGQNRAQLLKQLDLIAPVGVSTNDLQRMVATGSIGIPADEAASAAAAATAGAPAVTAPADDPEASDDFADFVVTSTIDAVLGRVGDNAELAGEARSIEQGRGDKARPTLIEKLDKLIDE